ncbi:toprim domain-containing protein [Methylobacter sp. G7]|uniref:toprim domain-containing protein n=1 Tax=Methylobacter sp. G7 TaxID=3230117 RepID=UPI003D807367
MRIDLNPQIIKLLIAEFKFKQTGAHLREGVCPSCSKKTLWTWVEKPGMVQCDRTNNCNYAATSKELFPELFENLNKKYPATVEIPNQTADAYLSLIRGFDPAQLKGWYEQGKYWHPRGDIGTASVRFYLDAAKTIMWERLIDDVTITKEDGDKEVRNKSFKGAFKGLWWQPPSLTINAKDEVYWCEGILDAIALNLNGFKAVSIMAGGTFPTESIKPFLGKQIKWVIAVDNDVTGRRCLQKHAAKLRELGERVGAALSGDTEDKQDWNDLHKTQKLSKKDMVEYRHLGRVELSQSYYEKALALWKHNIKKKYFVFVYAHSTYSFSIDDNEFEKAKTKILETSPETALKAEREAFTHASKIKEIATFKMDFLYFQKPDTGDDGQYFFRLKFSNNAPEVQLPFGGKTFGGAGDFKKAVMHQTPSALFTGSTKDLDYMYQNWMGRIPKIVKTLDYVGYDSTTKAYVYLDYAVENGNILKLNKESFFQLKKSGIKTTVDIKQKLNTTLVADFLPDYQAAFGTGGMVALSWWFGTLVVEQIRQQHRSYPFFEVVGEAGSGKSDMVDFLWKLLGREGESFNPNSSTLAGRTRKMAEVSNLPVVFNETDNEKVAEDRHMKAFNWDEQKDLYDGEFGRVTGVKSQDNSTKKPVFKAALMIVQNIPVIASEAIMSRIVHLQFDRSHHSIEGKHASDRLNMLPVMDVSGFMLHSVTKADAILTRFNEKFTQHKQDLQANPKIKLQRIIENHAKIMAFADCLSLVLPVSDATIAAVHRSLITMAEIRQESLNEEHPVVQQFWATFDYLDSQSKVMHDGVPMVDKNMINHSNNPEAEIAINLVHFGKVCREQKIEVMDDKELRRHLITSRKRKYLRNEAARSRLEGRTIRVWVFKR